MSQEVTNFKNTRENPTDAWKFYGEGTHNVNFWYKCFTILWPLSVPLRACVEFNPCASKRALTRKNFGDE